jgi:hypothetical protein
MDNQPTPQGVTPSQQTVKDQTIADSGDTRSVSSFSAQTTVDPATGSSITTRHTNVWSGQELPLALLWFVAGVIVLFLAGDFVFHLAGANNVGFASFVYSVGGAFAKPFTGIFNNGVPATGNVAVWADVLAAAVYAIVAGLLAKLYSIVASRRTVA